MSRHPHTKRLHFVRTQICFDVVTTYSQAALEHQVLVSMWLVALSQWKQLWLFSIQAQQEEVVFNTTQRQATLCDIGAWRCWKFYSKSKWTNTEKRTPPSIMTMTQQIPEWKFAGGWKYCGDLQQQSCHVPVLLPEHQLFAIARNRCWPWWTFGLAWCKYC